MTAQTSDQRRMETSDQRRMETKIRTDSREISLYDAVRTYRDEIKDAWKGQWLHRTFSGETLKAVIAELELDGEIVYEEGGRHRIDGICTQVEVDENYRYITLITLDHQRVYCITMVKAASKYESCPPDHVPTVLDCITIHAESLEQREDGTWLGYSESCHKTEDFVDTSPNPETEKPMTEERRQELLAKARAEMSDTDLEIERQVAQERGE